MVFAPDQDIHAPSGPPGYEGTRNDSCVYAREPLLHCPGRVPVA
jgi:hypothetical protein